MNKFKQQINKNFPDTTSIQIVMQIVDFQPKARDKKCAQSQEAMHSNSIPMNQQTSSTMEPLQGNDIYNATQHNEITKNINSFGNFIGLHYLRVLTDYWHGITNENLLKYKPNYEKMFSSKYFWCQYLSNKGAFSVLGQILKAQKGPLIFLTIMSILMGVISLFGAYYQRFLFWEHTEKDYHTSGWVFFSIIMTAAFVRFFLFNYLQSLANQVAINIRVHLQNAYIKCLIDLPHTKEVDLKGLVYFNYFSSIEVIMMALKAWPYFVSSVVIVFGIIGFVIDIVGWLGMILLGTTGLAFLMQLLLLYNMFHIHEHYAEISNERNSIWIFSTTFFMRLIESGMSSKFVKSILDLRKKETNTVFKYTILDGLIEILAESAAFFTVFVFYLIEEKNGHPSYKQIFECIVLFSVFKTPVKMMAYGVVFAMEMYGSAHGLQEMFDKCKTQEKIEDRMQFPKYYSHRSAFWTGDEFYTIGRPESQNIAQINIQGQLIGKYKGNFMIMVSKSGYTEQHDRFIEGLLPTSRKQMRYVKISDNTMILNESFESNITFGMPYDEGKFRKVIQVMNLDTIINSYRQKQHSILNENYVCAVDKELVQKISIARALYQDIDVIFIDHFVGPFFIPLLSKIKDYRNSRNQSTFISYQLGINLKIADRIVFLTSKGSFEEDSFQNLHNRSVEFKDYVDKQKVIRKNLTTNFMNLQKKVSLVGAEQNNEVEFHVNKLHDTIPSLSQPQTKQKQFPPLIYQQEIKTSYKNLFRFYNYNHFGAGIVLMFVLCIPPLIDLYMEVIAAESKNFFSFEEHLTEEGVHDEEHKITLRYGLAFALFFVMNIVKVLVLSIYLRSASYQIFRDLINRWMNSKAQPTVLNYHKKNGLDLERNLENIDIRTTTELDIGFTIVYEHLDVIIFASISSLLFLGVGIPFLIINIVIVVLMVKYSRLLFDSGRQNRSKINQFVKKLIRQRSQVRSYDQSEFFFKKYVQLNRIDVTYELNKDWLFEALAIIFELIIILMLMTVLIVSLTKFHYIHIENEAFLELSISFLIGFVNGGRLDLKIFRAIDRQVVGISCLWKMGEHHNHKVHQFKDLDIRAVETIQFENFSVDFFNEHLRNINVKFKKGQRVACIINCRHDPMGLGFLALFRVYDKEKVRGGIRVNGIDLYGQKITRQFMQSYVHFVSYESTFKTFGETVSNYIQGVFPNTTDEQIQGQMLKMWSVLECEPMFRLETKKQHLVGESMDCFRLLIALMSKCQVIVIEHCLHQLDLQKRQKITEWLINSEINIIIELTCSEQIASLYHRKIHFQEGEIVEGM